MANSIDGTKGVDFIGILNERDLFFIEVKNFQEFHTDSVSKPKFCDGAKILSTDIAKKVKDSIACIIAGKRNSTNDKLLWTKISNILIDDRKNIYFIFWLEDEYLQKEKNEHKIKFYQEELQKKLKWLIGTSRFVRILNRNTYQNEFNFKVEIST